MAGVQIKIHSATFSKSMNKRRKKVIQKFLDGMKEAAIEETGAMMPDMPNQTGILNSSYSASLSYSKKMVTFGSNANGKFADLKYASWIETGKRLGGSVQRIGNRKYFNKARNKKVMAHPRTKGLWRFKKTKENVLKSIKRIKL